MRSYLLTHPLSRGGKLWCDRVIEGVDQGDRTAMRLFGEAMRWTGAQVNIGNVFLDRLSVRNEGELLQLVESGRKLERLTLDAGDAWQTHEENGIDLLKAIIKMHPDRKLHILAALGGTMVEANGGAQ